MNSTGKTSLQTEVEYALAHIVLLAAMIFLLFWGYDYFKELCGKMSGGIAANNEAYAIATIVIAFISAWVRLHILSKEESLRSRTN